MALFLRSLAVLFALAPSAAFGATTGATCDQKTAKSVTLASLGFSGSPNSGSTPSSMESIEYIADVHQGSVDFQNSVSNSLAGVGIFRKRDTTQEEATLTCSKDESCYSLKDNSGKPSVMCFDQKTSTGRYTGGWINYKTLDWRLTDGSKGNFKTSAPPAKAVASSATTVANSENSSVAKQSVEKSHGVKAAGIQMGQFMVAVVASVVISAALAG